MRRNTMLPWELSRLRFAGDVPAAAASSSWDMPASWRAIRINEPAARSSAPSIPSSLIVQDWTGLGPDDLTRRRLAGAVRTIITHRLADPEAIANLAGTHTTTEVCAERYKIDPATRAARRNPTNTLKRAGRDKKESQSAPVTDPPNINATQAA